MFLSFFDSTWSLYYFPELINLENNINYKFSLNKVSEFFQITQYLATSENIFTSVMMFPQFIILLFLFGFFLLVFFNYFTNSSKDETIVDHDYLAMNITIEAEEEITSIDDLISPIIIIIYTFGWFFYIHFWTLLRDEPEHFFMSFLSITLYIVILFIPLVMLYDFGIFFSSYLRGSSTTPVFSMEVMYDTIAIFAFFIRLCVQAVRLVLMFFVYVSLHDMIIYFDLFDLITFRKETLWTDICGLQLNVSSLSYFFFLQVPGHFLHWIYEVIHTFFVLTGQFIAFFAMVFWLFFFLYTLFVFDAQEAFLSAKRGFYKIKNQNYTEYKN